MFNVCVKRSANARFLRKTLQNLYSTSIEPVTKDPSKEYYDKELKKYDTLKNITRKVKEKKPQREPFAKNLFLGKFDKEVLTFPEMELQDVRKTEADAQELGKLLQQKHMINVDSFANKNFRQNLSDHQAIGLQASQFLEGRECSPMEVMRFLESLLGHNLHQSILHHEMLGVETLNRFGSEALKKKYLYPIMKGESVCAYAIYEPSFPDLFEMTTKAKLSDDNKHWVLNGQKTFVVNGSTADCLIVFAISDEVKFDVDIMKRVSAFLVEKDFKGVSWNKMDQCDTEVAEVSLDNVQVPVENVIGEIHTGDEIIKGIMSDFRLSCGAACNVLAKEIINKYYETLRQQSTSQFDKLATDSAKSKIGEMVMYQYALESVTYLTAGLQEWYENQDTLVESAIVKILASEAVFNISTICLDTLTFETALKNHWSRQTHEKALNFLTLHEPNDSLRSFISLYGLQHAASSISDTVKKMRNPFYNAAFVFKRNLFTRSEPKLDLDLYGHLHPSLEEPSKQLEKSVKRLERIVEYLMTNHGTEVANRHVQLRSLANIVIECYAMTAVLARSSRSYCIGLQFAGYEIMLATLYCNVALERIENWMKQIVHLEKKINENLEIAVGKRLVESKGYFLTEPIHRFF